VTAVQNPLTSLSDEVAATKRIIALQDGPVILVGHSWGGAVITQAGDDPKVVGLVYAAAYTPDAGTSANETSIPFGVTPGQKTITVDAQHFASLKPEGVFESIAQDLPMEERRLFLAVQGQSYAPMSDEKITVAAWKSKPSWHSFRPTIGCFPRPCRRPARRSRTGRPRAWLRATSLCCSSPRRSPT
jgi:pimeloyl-ACP methyl ester carboxylesterase